jgi:hypothetical protein
MARIATPNAAKAMVLNRERMVAETVIGARISSANGLCRPPVR